MGNYSDVQKSDFNNTSNFDKINFPSETNYDKELMQNFKYFNVFWYEPINTNYFDRFKKYFQNVLFIKENNIKSSIEFFEKESSSDEWIVVICGSLEKELIKILEQNECINAFFVFCWNAELYEEQIKKIKKLKCLTSDIEILRKKFVEINKNYIFPNFKYNNIDKINLLDDFHFIYNSGNLQSENEFALNSVKREIKNHLKEINKIRNRYNNFCLKSYNYLKREKCIKDFKESVPDDNHEFLLYPKCR